MWSCSIVTLDKFANVLEHRLMYIRYTRIYTYLPYYILCVQFVWTRWTWRFDENLIDSLLRIFFQRSYHTVIATWLCNHLCVRTNPSNEFPLITQSSIVHVTCYTLLIEDRYWITITELPYLKNQSLTYIVTTYRISLWDRGFENLYK